MFSTIINALKARKARKIAAKMAKIEVERLAQIKYDEEQKKLKAQRLAREAKIPTIEISVELKNRSLLAFYTLARYSPDNDEGDYYQKIHLNDAKVVKASIENSKGLRIDVAKRTIEAFSMLARCLPDNDEGDYWHQVYKNDMNTIQIALTTRNTLAQKV